MTWDQPRLTALRTLLAELYPRELEQRRIVVESGLRQAAIAFDPSADTSWFNILLYANHQSRVDTILDLARQENPDNELLRRAHESQPPRVIQGPDIKSGIPWHGPSNTRALQEKILGAMSALVPVSHLALGIRRARAVVRIELANGSTGSGFLTTDDRLVTNHHVLPDRQSAEKAKAQFNFQKTIEGLDEPVEEARLAPGDFFLTSKEDDFTVVRVAGKPTERWGALDLRPSSAAANDRVNIVQHPAGGPKQLSLHSNVVVFSGQGRLQYLTDTMPGSSGAPVFDDAWNVVAVHHSGGWMPEPGKDPMRLFFRNEGILIDVIIAAIEAGGRG